MLQQKRRLFWIERRNVDIFVGYNSFILTGSIVFANSSIYSRYSPYSASRFILISLKVIQTNNTDKRINQLSLTILLPE